jgi:hypothetical protein
LNESGILTGFCLVFGVSAVPVDFFFVIMLFLMTLRCYCHTPIAFNWPLD